MANFIIKYKHILNNLAYIRKRTSKKIIAVVKNNAYNTGLLKSVATLIKGGVSNFFVTEITEAITIKNTYPKVTVIVMNIASHSELELARKYDLHVSINDETILKQPEKYRQLKLHLNYNVGMNRFGVTNLTTLLKICRQDLNIIGLYTHFAFAEENDLTFHLKQLDKFKKVVKQCTEIRKFEYIHAENTATFLQHSHLLTCCTHLRLGILLFGYSSIAPVKTLYPTIYITAKIITLRQVNTNDYIGYGFTPQMTAPKKIAVLDIGYGHGLLKERIHYPVIIGDQKYKIFKMSMSHAFIYADDRLKIGDNVEIYGDMIRIDDIKNTIGITNSYQMACLNNN